MLEKLTKNSKSTTQSGKSRIYHTIANIKKEKIVKKKWENEFYVDCIASNNYQELSKGELE